MSKKRILAGTMGRPMGKKDMVFCIIHCDNAKPYINYDYFLNSDDEDTRAKAKDEYPLVLAQMRWDGKLGFPGGNVEQHHETLIDAIKAELEEEINFKNVDVTRLKPLSTIADSKRHITAFEYSVTEEELDEIFKNSLTAKHFKSENTGSIMLQLHELSIPNLKNQIFSGTGNLELEIFISEVLNK